MSTQYVMPVGMHDELVTAAYRKRGYSVSESAQAARFCRLAAWHGIRTHNAIKALHLDELFGSAVGGCVPGAVIDKLESRFSAVQRWDGNRKLGQAVAFEAMDTCMELADTHGVGVVAVDNAFHYLWGGGYVIEAANKGYIAYTACTAALAEVVPFGGRHPTLGTNPHSWAFPTTDAIGFPICIDWATSTVAMGRVQQFARENKPLPANAAVDAEGNPTTNPHQVAALTPFGAHKGYGLALIDELLGAYTGGSLPTLRNRWDQGPEDEKHTANFFFQCIHPDAVAVSFARGRSQQENVKAVLDDILGHGNEQCLLPGQIEAEAARQSQRHGGLLFSTAEVDAFREIAAEAEYAFDESQLGQVAVEV